MDGINVNKFELQMANGVPQNSEKYSNDLYRVYVVSWNVGSRFPDNISLRNLLGLDKFAKSSARHNLPDIYAIGLQEINTQPQQQVIGLFKEDSWTLKTKDLLSRFDYVLVKTEQMQGLLIIIYVKRQHIPYLIDIDSECTRTGFGGMWGNKGAVSIRFNFHGCALVFINSHLAAHDHQLEERVNDFMQIVENHHYRVSNFPDIYHHDFVFWFGDLNFRLNGDDAAAEICSKLNANTTLQELIKHDQLYYLRRVTEEAFSKFYESKPKFPPTFKFVEGTIEYDLKRRPAWTDRILYAVQPHKSQPDKDFLIEQTTYDSHPVYCISDHKPVSSQFIIKFHSHCEINRIEFDPITIWNIGENNIIQYKKSVNFEERKHDWIGVYPINYNSLRQYKAYEYVNQAEPPTFAADDDSPNDQFFVSTGTNKHSARDRIQRQQIGEGEIVRLDFAGGNELIDGEEYILIYFENSGMCGVSSIAGISDKFTAKTKHSSSKHK